jgi:hypothetical protein
LLQLQDKDGNILPDEVSLPADGGAFTAYVSLPWIGKSLPVRVDLGLSIRGAGPALLQASWVVPFQVETVWQARFRVIGDLFLGEPALLLSIGLLFIGWVREETRRRQEEVHQILSEDLDRIRSEIPQNPLEALRRFAVLENRLAGRRGSSARQDEIFLNRLEAARADLVARQGDILRKAGESYQQGDLVGCLFWLDTLAKILPAQPPSETAPRAASREQLLGACEALRQPILADEQGQRAVSAAFGLWRNPSQEDAREVIIAVLLAVKRWRAAFLYDQFCKEDGWVRRLLNDERLKDIAGTLVTPHYSLPGGAEEPRPVLAGPVQDWLGQLGLDDNPFLPLTPEIDELLRLVTRPAPQIIYSASITDLIEGARAVGSHFERKERAMTVHLNLPFHELDGQDPEFDSLKIVAQALAERWLDLLACNPTTFLDLKRDVRLLLVEYLTWSAGSLETLRLWLRQRGVEATREGSQLLNEISAFAPCAAPRQPTLGRLLSWLDLRLPGLEMVVVLVNGTFPISRQCVQKQAADLASLSGMLAERRILLKLWLPADQVPPSAPGLTPLPLPRVDLCWSAAQLESNLRRRFQAASAIGELTFDDLFGPRVQLRDYYMHLLIHASRGSLTRMYQIGSDLIRRRIESDTSLDQEGAAFYLTEQDFMEILREHGDQPNAP